MAQSATQKQARIPTFGKFVSLIQKNFGAELKRTDVSESNKLELIVQSDEGRTSTISLDKLYRFYVDTSLQHPNLTTKELVDLSKSFVDNYRSKTHNLSPLFRVKQVQVPRGTTIEQCCIR